MEKNATENVWNASDYFCEHLAWIEHQFLSGIRDSTKAGSLWGMMRGVGGVRKSIHQSWLAKGLGLKLGLLCWGFKGVQEEILSEEASTLQIGSVAFPPGQYTSPQLHPCHRPFDQDGHQDSSSALPIGVARGVVVIVVGNGLGDTSSNPGRETDCISHSTNTLGKGMNPIILPPAMGK